MAAAARAVDELRDAHVARDREQHVRVAPLEIRPQLAKPITVPAHELPAAPGTAL